MMTCSDLDLFYGKAKFGYLGFSMGKIENSAFPETIAASDLKVGRCRQLIEFLKVLSIEGQGLFYHIFSRFCMFCALVGQDIR